ncbi:hypothetical protein [Trichothermofontia sp.]
MSRNGFGSQQSRRNYPYCSRSLICLGAMGQSISEFTQFLKGNWQNLAIFAA